MWYKINEREYINLNNVTQVLRGEGTQDRVIYFSFAGALAHGEMPYIVKTFKSTEERGAEYKRIISKLNLI